MIDLFKQHKDKIFCIGANKTGTTSLEKALKDFGYKLGNQAQGELLLENYIKRDFKAIVRFCNTADAFQDAPFSFKHTFIALDQAYPNSKFILTVRDNDEQWYQSLKKFHSNLFAKNGLLPSSDDLKSATYRYKGFIWTVMNKVFGINESDNPYEESILKSYYNSHNNEVLDYFKHKNNLLVINLSDKSSYKKFCDFIGKKPLYNEFPWENKTK